MKAFTEPLGHSAGEHFPHNSSLLVSETRFIVARGRGLSCSHPSLEWHLSGTNSGSSLSLEETDSCWQRIFLSVLEQ